MLNDNQRSRHGVDATRCLEAYKRRLPPSVLPQLLAAPCSVRAQHSSACSLLSAPLCRPPTVRSARHWQLEGMSPRHRLQASLWPSLTTSLTAAVLQPPPTTTSHLHMSRYDLLCARRRQPWEGQTRGGSRGLHLFHCGARPRGTIPGSVANSPHRNHIGCTSWLACLYARVSRLASGSAAASHLTIRY